MNQRIRAAAVTVAVMLAVPVIASAAHWPNFGGDAGRSGYQPVLSAKTPTELKWTAGDPGTIRNSIVTTAGRDETERFLAYGKQQVVTGASNDRADVHLRSLADGAEKIPAASQDVDDSEDDPDAFGTASPTVTDGRAPGGIGVSFADSSTGAGPGQLFVVHNDTDSPARNEASCPAEPSRRASTNDIAIAQFDEATGNKVRDVAVGPAAELAVPNACPVRPQVTNGFTIQSSPVITPPIDANGTRWLFFIARVDTPSDATPASRLFGVRIQNASRPEAVIEADTPQVRDVPGANTLASPSIAYLRDPSRPGVVPYVVVPTTGAGSDIRTFKVENIGIEGPAVAPDIAGDPQTVSIPVSSNGMLPGQPGSGVEKATALFAAYDTGTQTVVRKFEQVGDNGVLTAATGSNAVPVEGRPSAALAVTATSQSPGRVVVATGQNLILLDSHTLEVADRFRDINAAESPESPLTPGTNGFSRNVPAASGGLVFITNDIGVQLVLRESDGEPVAPGDFNEAPQNNLSAFGLGQPSYTEGHLQFLTDRGVFVYRTGVVTKAPTASLDLRPNPARPGEPVTFDGTASSDPDGTIVKYEWDIGDGNFVEREPRFEFAYPQPGTFRVRLRVTDNHGGTAVAQRDLVVSAGQAPNASFTASPNPAQTGRTVTFDGRGSSDADGRIVRYEWDLDGNGAFETNGGGNPTTTRAYTSPGIYNVRLRVTDDRGLTAETARQLVVTRAQRREPGLSARVRPERDASLPYVFRTRGRLTPPSGVKRSDGCRGRVVVIVKAGKNTISRRVSRVNRETCRYSSKVTFDDRERLDTRTRLRFKARFQGNRFLLPKSAKTRTVRIG